MPGPGDYDADDKMTKTSARQVIISQSEKRELWSEKTGADIPGPGNYTE